MNYYPLLVFTHVLASMGIFASLGIEAVSLARLRRADSPAEARASAGLLAVPGRLGPIAMLLTLASGMWMMAEAWGHAPWIVSAFVGLVGMAAAGAVTLRRMRRLRAALADEAGAEVSGAFRSIRSAPALLVSLRLRLAIGVAIVGLMTTKPSGVLGASLLLAAGVLAGLVAGFPSAARRAQPAGLAGGGSA